MCNIFAIEALCIRADFKEFQELRFSMVEALSMPWFWLHL